MNDDYHAHLRDYASSHSGAVVLDRCPSCLAMEEDNHKTQWQYETRPRQKRDQEKNQEKEDPGIVFNGNTYHVFDFVLYRTEKGPSKIGQIIEVVIPRGAGRSSVSFRVKKVGRIWDLVGEIVDPREELKDEASGPQFHACLLLTLH